MSLSSEGVIALVSLIIAVAGSASLIKFGRFLRGQCRSSGSDHSDAHTVANPTVDLESGAGSVAGPTMPHSSRWTGRNVIYVRKTVVLEERVFSIHKPR
ncbi:hypothetical protein F5883DRAFT_539273 [Diaporthe sp. PMI_573]|nr:hypothetical protein F5883DRAFT_539273 [Diaporthaceae sp. PMI_573]